MQKLKADVEILFNEFKMKWPNDASDHEAKIEYATEFMSKLERLESEDLPRHEKNFFALLNRQSSLYATQLKYLLDSETQKILERLEEVNNCLSDVPFNFLDKNPTFLLIKTTRKNSVELTDFKQRLQDVASHSLDEDRSTAEYRFNIQKKIVDDLKSQDRDKILWREAVIDVRNHLEFIGVELDKDKKEVESYRSGAGKSGGQRQKLAATCLAAALRYQLGGRDLGYPAYATVVFDEAFAKTDNEHTKLAMDIFTKLGFQLIMATPNKGVKVAEPYIGGAGVVFIKDRNSSNISLISYNFDNRQLDWTEFDKSDAIENGADDLNQSELQQLTESDDVQPNETLYSELDKRRSKEDLTKS
jgi:uncharacterized protein YPO0396